jgi:hypothetical protein
MAGEIVSAPGSRDYAISLEESRGFHSLWFVKLNEYDALERIHPQNELSG